MNEFDAFRAITRRALWINYVSPLVCMPPGPDSSGSSTDNISNLETEPTYRAAGTTLSISDESATSFRLSWVVLPEAYAYVVYRAPSLDGPFVQLVAGVVDNFWVDAPGTIGTYFYKVTGIEPNFGETYASNVVSGTIV